MAGESTIGGRIRRARGAAGARRGSRISQADLGAMIGRSRSAVNSWETGRTVPDEYDLVRLEEALGADLREPAPSAPRPDPDEVEFYDALGRLRDNPVSRKLGLDLDGWQRSFEELKRRAEVGRVAYRAS